VRLSNNRIAAIGVLVVSGAAMAAILTMRDHPPSPALIPTATWFAEHPDARRDTLDMCRNDPERVRQANAQIACGRATQADVAINSLDSLE